MVQVCQGACELSRRLGRRLGGRPLLEWVIRRVTDCTRLDGVIVVASDTPELRAITDFVPLDVPIFFGTEADALGRFVRALEQYPARAIVRVRGDNPFVDPALIDRLVRTAETHPTCDYVSYLSADGRPAILSPVGVYAEWVRARTLRAAARAAKDPADRTQVTRYVYSHPERFQVRLIPAPPEIDRDDVRLTVDGEEDWEHALAIYDALGPDCLDWQRIAVLLNHQPQLRSRMATLNRVDAGH